MSLSDQHTEALQTAWKTFIDVKDEGIIDFDEWNNSIQRLNCGLTQTQIRNVFKLIDKQNSGHIDQTDFIKAISNNNNNNNNELSMIYSCITNSNNNTHSSQQMNGNYNETKEDNEMKKWHKIFINLFGDLSTITQDVWVNKILSLNIDSISEDDLRLFHAIMDSQFRLCFDFDEFYETFTIDSLHHKQMNLMRDTLKNVLLPKPKAKVITKKETKEISIQTDKIDGEVLIDEEIDDLERHILEEEKYLEVMDKIDSLKKQNDKIFAWENAYSWTEYGVCNWLNDIGFKNAKYINTFKDKGINGYILLNEFNITNVKTELNISENDALLIEKEIFILKKKHIELEKKRVREENKQQENESSDSQFYKRKCEHLTRELVRMKKIEQMFKKNRRETESKLKQLECNLYFGSLNQTHLMQTFDLKQLFEMQTAYNKTLLNIQQSIQSKVMTQNVQNTNI